MANKTQRASLRRETKSYVRDKRWRTVWPSIMKDINPEWVEMQVKDLSPLSSPKGHSKSDSIKRKYDKLDSDVDWTEIVEREEPPANERPRDEAEHSPHTPPDPPTTPSVSSSGKGLEKKDLENDHDEDQRNFTPIHFPGLTSNQNELAKFAELMGKNEAFRSSILEIT